MYVRRYFETVCLYVSASLRHQVQYFKQKFLEKPEASIDLANFSCLGASETWRYPSSKNSTVNGFGWAEGPGMLKLPSALRAPGLAFEQLGIAAYRVLARLTSLLCRDLAFPWGERGGIHVIRKWRLNGQINQIIFALDVVKMVQKEALHVFMLLCDERQKSFAKKACWKTVLEL